MTFPEEETPAVTDTVHAVLEEAKGAGVWVTGGGLMDPEEVSLVATDGTVTDGLIPENAAYLGGFSILDVPSREQALKWAAKFAAACRCAQEVREIMHDPLV